ncbi:hypothetical protein OG760_13455 [Streptomyces sp. NBC_00963]|uniref:hypothetical protein n=1 Tax=Streptomyces sp. NBC_00963 TaxID=2903697 RepID=UPI003869EBF9|nr:hypothetical protein OG760_13455 [Streptomyces sp. NBC_00963]
MNRDTRPTDSPDAADPCAGNPLAMALAAMDELHEALHQHGIALPSLTVDLASCTTTTAPRPLVELGRVNLRTAERLADVLRQAGRA